MPDPTDPDTAYARKSWKTAVPEKIRPIVPPNQTAKLDLVVSMVMAKASLTDPLTIWASLENSLINCGALTFNTDDERGYYHDSIDVKMWLEDQHGNIRTDFKRVADGPGTANGDVSSSSTVSFSFSASGNVGFFGSTGTGGGGAGASSSNSYSVSTNLKDFRVFNASNDHTIEHNYLMHASTAGEYNKPGDLLIQKSAAPGVFGDIAGAFTKGRFGELPDLCLSNMGFATQAVWQATHSHDIDETLRLRITIDQRVKRVTLVQGSRDVLGVTVYAAGIVIPISATYHYGHTEAIPLGELILTPTTSPM